MTIEKQALPDGWELLPLSSVGLWRGGGTPSKANSLYWNGSIPWVSPKDMKTTSIHDTEDHITHEAVEESATTIIAQDSVLMVVRSGILSHSLPIAVNRIPVALNQDLKACTPSKGIDADYVAWALRRFNREILGGCQKDGTTVASIEFERLKRFEIPVGPHPEQRRIVAKLEELFSELDAGVEALRRAQRRLARYRQSLLQAAVTGELTREWREQDAHVVDHAEVLLSKILADRDGITIRKGRQAQANRDAGLELPPIPEKWTWCRLPEIGELARGKSRHRPRDAEHLYVGPYPFIQTGEIRKSLGSISQYEQTYSEAGLAQSRLWPRGTLCITIAANIAETGVLQFEACFPDSVVGFIPHSSLEVRFFETFIRSEKERLESYAPATAQKNINLETLSSLAVPLPPIEEQEAILAELDRRLSAADVLEATLRAGLCRAERLRQSILEGTFRGELVPQDPHDEPAEALLARLKAIVPDTLAPRRRGRPPKAEPAEPLPPRRRGRPRKAATLASGGSA